MSDNEKDQKLMPVTATIIFLSNGRAIESSKDIHDGLSARRGTPHASDYERHSERQAAGISADFRVLMRSSPMVE